MRNGALAGLLLLLVGCGGSSSAPSAVPAPTPSTDTRTTETLTYTLVLFPQGWAIAGPKFTTRAAGPIDVTASFLPLFPLNFGIDLLYLGGDVPHNEGSGGPMTIGFGPTLTGHWDVGFVGEFQARIYPANASPPLAVPAAGVPIPVVFTITHP